MSLSLLLVSLSLTDRTSSIGQMINGYLQQAVDLNDTAVHLLFSANRWEQQQSMLDDLNNGITLVVDRYAFSGVAFTAAKEVGVKGGFILAR